jgi:hypothetical protein
MALSGIYGLFARENKKAAIGIAAFGTFALCLNHLVSGCAPAAEAAIGNQ